MRLNRTFVHVFAYGALCALAAGLIVWGIRAHGVYSAEAEEFASPAVIQAPRASSVGARVDVELGGGGSLSALYVAPKNGAVIIYLHGSPGDAVAFDPEMTALRGHGFGALALDLPGYGGSPGARVWDGSYARAVSSAIDFVLAQSASQPTAIGVHGYSMGTAVAAWAANLDARIGPMVLVATFTNLREQIAWQVRSRIPGMPAVAHFAAGQAGVDIDALDPRNALAGRDAPLLLIAGALDAIIPRSMPEELVEASSHARLWVAEDVGHVGFAEISGEPYMEQLRVFWSENLLTGSQSSATDPLHTQGFGE